MNQYNIYVGLNDQFTRKQMHDTERYVKILKHICKAYRASFTFSVQEGGYIYENGDLEHEKSLHISMLDQPEETVNAVARDLCTFFNQESVLIVQSDVKMYYMNGEREVIDHISSKHKINTDEA